MGFKTTFNPFTGALDFYKEGSIDAATLARITTLENNEIKVAYYASISASSGTITKPVNSTILPGELPDGALAYVETINNGEPSTEAPVTSSGQIVTVSSFNSSGAYTLSGTPSSFPVVLIYVLKIQAKYYSNLVEENIIATESLDVDEYIKVAARHHLYNNFI